MEEERGMCVLGLSVQVRYGPTGVDPTHSHQDRTGAEMLGKRG